MEVDRVYDGKKPRPWYCLLGLHRGRTVRDTGFTRYRECATCGTRWITQGRGGYQPIDRRWLRTGEWSNWAWPRRVS